MAKTIIGRQIASTEWKAVEIVESNWENYSWEPLVYRRIGDIVFIHGCGNVKSTGQKLLEYEIAKNLPKPRQNTGISVADNAETSSSNVVVSNDGNLNLYTAGVTRGIYICLSYITRE